MTRRWAALAAVIIVFVALQMGALTHLRLFGVYPELLVVVVCSVALHRGPWTGAAFGLVFGVINDLPGGHLVGLSAVGYASAGIVAGILGARVFPERWLVVASAIALGTVVHQAVYAAGAYAFGFVLPVWDVGLRMIGPLVTYHLVLTPAVHPLTRRLVEVFMPQGLDG